MQVIRIKSINIGVPRTTVYQGKELNTGIYKEPADGDVYLSPLNFAGDAQADLVHHGGADKAVCVYPYEHYAYWEQRLGTQLAMAAFGENLTTEGKTEQDVRLGDIYELGEAVVQISQPRQPCFKLGHKHQTPELPAWVRETGFTGYYFRVLKPGLVSHTDTLNLVEPGPSDMTVARANQIMYRKPEDELEIRHLLAVEALAASWRGMLEKRLEKVE
ncbi:MOSC domain-containing protein [Xylanibacillus composti]|uniref:MOSC domain-containing protein n=1 Tax=Xylanibacillus composti TaxID=1572762 RepID=A0A8J4M405_9BACL|nr:MOSC domain-containing protein [Xylanibacillus composti]MDT9723696.1 MOSC domain-containing protein [Xylanibacillus composti]GIQ71415.1 MOSC domain-containing protein [Xylanibacillus composti]